MHPLDCLVPEWGGDLFPLREVGKGRRRQVALEVGSPVLLQPEGPAAALSDPGLSRKWECAPLIPQDPAVQMGPQRLW